jgi:DnaJ-class molecular chaperone
MIEVPKNLTSHQKKLLREFAETENENVLPETNKFFDKLKKYFGN